jgi:hypothetical protein
VGGSIVISEPDGGIVLGGGSGGAGTGLGSPVIGVPSGQIPCDADATAPDGGFDQSRAMRSPFCPQMMWNASPAIRKGPLSRNR